MAVETQHVVTLDAAPESSAEGPWAADVVTHTHGVENERSARWLTCEDYVFHEELEVFGGPTYAFVDGDETHYVQECDVDTIMLTREVLDR